MNKTSLYYIANNEIAQGVPIRIKINNDIGGVTLAFVSKEIGEEYINHLNLPSTCQVISSNDVNNDKYYSKDKVLIFNSAKEIINTYREQANTNWSKLLTEWPND